MIRKVARPLLATVFVTSGVDALLHPAARAKQATPLLDLIGPAVGLPDNKEMLVRAEAVVTVAGGALLATGRVPRLAATVLALTLVPTAIATHPFWEKSDPDERRRERTEFLKDLGLLGGLLLASVDTAGKPGLAWRAQHARKAAAKKIASAQESLG